MHDPALAALDAPEPQMTSEVAEARRPYLTARATRRIKAERRRLGVRSSAIVRTESVDPSQITRGRLDPPVVWPGCAAFSQYREELNQTRIVELIKSTGLFDDLLAVERGLSKSGGRERKPGSYVLAFFAFVQSGKADIQPWWGESEVALWWAAGFDAKPKYDIVRIRFIELEEKCIEDFFDATIPVIRLAQERSGGLVGWDMSLDCTEAETNARLHHDCQHGEGCPGWGTNIADRHGNFRDPRSQRQADASKGRGPAHNQPADETADADDERAPSQLAAKMTVQDAALMRQLRSAEPLDEDGDREPANPGFERAYYDVKRGVPRIRMGKHWFRTRDATAGLRSKNGPRGGVKTWLGFYNAKGTCHTFSTNIVNLVEGADEQESSLFDEIKERAIRILGEDHIRSLTTDRGFMSRAVHQSGANSGITVISPWIRRANDVDGTPPDFDDFDRDGLPRCKFCGGETEWVRFARHATDQTKLGARKQQVTGEAPTKVQPRIWYRCDNPFTRCKDAQGNARIQSMLISREPRLLKPLWANTAPYQALIKAGLADERVHHQARERYANGGKEVSSRPARCGRDWQQLRAHASVALDWLKICWVQGWLPETPFGGSVCRNVEPPYLQIGDDLLFEMQTERRAAGLKRPYGKHARKHDADAPMRPDRLKRIIQADTGEVIAEGQTEEALRAYFGNLRPSDRKFFVIEDDPNAGPTSTPGVGDTGPPMRTEYDIVDGARQVPNDGGRYSD